MYSPLLLLFWVSLANVLAVQTGGRRAVLQQGAIRPKPLLPEDVSQTQATDVVFCKLKCVSKMQLDVYAEEMDGPNRGLMKLIGSMKSGTTTSMALHEKQRIHYTLSGCPEAIEGSFLLSSRENLYPVGQGMDSECPDLLEELKVEQEYSRSYEAQHGVPWRHYYGFMLPNLGPRGPPKIASKMWPAEWEGQLHTVRTRHGYNQAREIRGENDSDSSASSDDLQLSLQVLSTSPRVFAIKNFLSPEEADALVQLGCGHLQDSVVGSPTTGGTLSDKVQRSSQTAWLAPEESPLVKSIYRRAADVLNVRQEDMMQWSEPMQMVYYQKTQHYSAHYDFEVTSTAPQSRFATLLLYLNDQASEDAGGETAFMVAKREDDSSKGFKIHPGKCSAVLFYNLCPDGNCDINSLHAALPVKLGEKWAANIWLWA